MAVLMYGFWLILNGRITGEILLLGLPVAALSMLFMCKFCDWSVRKERGLYRCVPLIFAYIGVLIWEIVKANLSILRVIFVTRPTPVVRTIPLRLKNRITRCLLANSITLTPGTITLSMRGDCMTIHCLTRELADGLDEVVFEKWLLKIEEALHG